MSKTNPISDAKKKEIAKLKKEYPIPPELADGFIYQADENHELFIFVKVTKGRGENQEEFYVICCSPISIVAKLRKINDRDSYALRIKFLDMNGKQRQINLNRADLASNTTVLRVLMSKGVRVFGKDGKEALINMLSVCNPKREIILVSRTGWHDLDDGEMAYACPNGEIILTKPSLKVELSNIEDCTVRLKAGTLQGWTDAIRIVASLSGCEHWHFTIAASFAGVLIDLLNLDTCGVNLSGQSSGGKTTALRLAVSVWSLPDEEHEETLLKSWLTTANALEVLAAQANGTLLALDELSHADGETVKQALYILASGSGKSRGTITADNELGSLKRKSWKTFIISSGEQSVSAKIKKDRVDFQPGMTVRIADIDVTDINRTVDEKVFSQFEKAVKSNYGHAGEAFVRHLFDSGLFKNEAELHHRIEHAINRLAGGNADSMIKRSARIFALVDVSAHIAKEAGILPDNLDIDNAVRWAWEKYRASDDAEALDPEQLIIEQLQGFVAANKGTRIKDIDNPEPYGGKTLGWYDHECIYLPVDTVMQATKYAWKQEMLSRKLANAGLIKKREEPNRAIIRNIPQIGKVKAYALDRKQLMQDSGDFKIEEITDGKTTLYTKPGTN